MLAQFPCAAYGNTYVLNGSKINDAQFLARSGIDVLLHTAIGEVYRMSYNFTFFFINNQSMTYP